MPVFTGKITCEEGKLKGTEVNFQFNPSEVSITKANRFNPTLTRAGNVPQWEFIGGEPRIMTLDAIFDSYLPRNSQGKDVQEQDVRTAINHLFDFMMVDDQIKSQDGQQSHLGRPPRCCLQWARDSQYQFDCYITCCTVKYTIFTSEGVPGRAELNIELTEAVDPANKSSQNPTSRGEPGRRVWLVQEGDRLDWIAFQEYGDAAQWRLIAEANHLSHPLHLVPGMVLAIPPR